MANGDTVIVTSEDRIQEMLDAALTATLSRALEDIDLPIHKRARKEVLSNRETMAFLDLSKSTLQRYRDDGTLPYMKLGGNVYYRRDDLLRVLEEGRVNGAAT